MDLLAVQETLKSLLQNHGSKASILWHSDFFLSFFFFHFSIVYNTEKLQTIYRPVYKRLVQIIMDYTFSIHFSSVTQSCPTLCDHMNHSTPGLPVHHQLPEVTQTHVHQVGDAIQPSNPLLSSSPPAPSPSQHQGLFQWVNSLQKVAKILEFQL